MVRLRKSRQHSWLVLLCIVTLLTSYRVVKSDDSNQVLRVPAEAVVPEADEPSEPVESYLNQAKTSESTASLESQSNNQPATTQTSSPSVEPLNGADSTIRVTKLDTTSTSRSPKSTPTVTSVHQVWTASSSGSLDELSPEMISKLGHNMPFLTAYALRPRLVGASPPAEEEAGGLESAAAGAPRTQIQAPLALSSSLQAGSLGDFNEFKVETSSTSRSEHLHKRRTTLKREPAKTQPPRGLAFGSLKRSSSGRVAKRASKRSGSSRPSTLGRAPKRSRIPRRSAARRSGALMKSQARTNRLRRKLNRGNLEHHMRAIKFGRQQSVELGGGSSAASQEVDAAGVKGGRAPGTKKPPPFFGSRMNATGAPTSTEETSTRKDNEGLDNEDQDDTGGRMEGSKASGAAGNEIADNSIATRGGVSEEESDLEPEPKRVGDDDVEEDGDTVLVEPKSDGVDDDPDPASEGGASVPGAADETPGSPEMKSVPGAPDEKRMESGGGIAGSSARKGGDSDESGAEDDEQDGDGGEPKARRVNRERPNPGQTDLAAGGGIGATIGGGGGSGQRGGGDSGAEELPDSNVDDSASGGARGGGSTLGVEPGVEFADEEGRGGNENTAGGGAGARDDSGASRPGPPASQGDEGADDDDADDADDQTGQNDVDYRDEPDRQDERSASGAGRRPEGGQSQAGRKLPAKPAHTPDASNARAGDRNHGKDCHHDDGSYDHHADHHSGHHHDHHDTTKWLQEAIPGEPGDDYPVFTRPNATSFNCRDQKYPGYYADVEARCQVFHICQMDGRQDSFICPNGTIFSQLTRVCVWWNSFDCEDAPKYYDLNQLLYKAASARGESSIEGGAELRPLDGMPIRGGQGKTSPKKSLDDDSGSSLDSLLKNMRHSGGGAISSEDEASIQRKATITPSDDREGLNNVDDSPKNIKQMADTPARLRSKDPRRSRRASNKPTHRPRVLKSRRVSKNVTERKRASGKQPVKPKRRA